jgi:putative hemolysin
VVYVDGEVLVEPGYGQNIVNLPANAGEKKSILNAKLRNSSQLSLTNEIAIPKIAVDDANFHKQPSAFQPNPSPVFQQNIVNPTSIYTTQNGSNSATSKRVRQTSMSTSTG